MTLSRLPKVRLSSSQRNTIIQMLIIFIAGLVPLLWFKPGFIISASDSFPIFLNSHKTLTSATYLWSQNTMGTAELMPAFLIYQYLATFLSVLGFSIGAVEIIFQIIFFMGAGLSMFFLTKTFYPKLNLAPLIAGLFYMFNFFVLESRLNAGMVWIYAFIPLMMAMLIRAINAAYQQNGKSTNKMIICFAIVSTVALSFASINPTNIALALFALVVILIYYLFKYRSHLSPFFITLGKIALIAIPINLWWMLPLLNVYFFSPQMLNSQISVVDWSWTQARSSFLNLFWLNGIWGWLPTYIPFINSYPHGNTYPAPPSTGNPALAILVFVPFLVGASALLFKSDKSRFNAYVMLSVLVFLFLAKGLNDGGISGLHLGQINSLLYNLPLMNMFREPTSKFSMLIVIFLAPLIGYAGAHLANIKIGKSKRLIKIGVPTLLIAVFVIASFPIVGIVPTSKTLDGTTVVANPLETLTQYPDGTMILPSSYINIPSYWYDASSWINSQNGTDAVLLTPLDDFYQMPYNWNNSYYGTGYYGTDQLLERLFEKPIISTDYLYSYELKPNTVAVLHQLQTDVENNNTAEFKNFLDLLNIKYILQRNDVMNSSDRNIISPDQMRVFLSQQPYLHLVKSFGQLDVYDYSEAKPSIYAMPLSTFNQTNIEIIPNTAIDEVWNFSSPTDIQDWANSSELRQSQSSTGITMDGSFLKAVLPNPTSVWENVSSPLVVVNSGSTYTIKFNFEGNVSALVVKVLGCAENGTELDETNYGVYFNNFTFSNVALTFNPSIYDKDLQLQFCANLTSPQFVSNAFWLSNVRVTSQNFTLESTNINSLFAPDPSQSVALLNSEIINPTKMVVTVNATQPFIIATSQALDKSWVAIVNGQQVKPSPLYLGLEGFSIAETGKLTITIEYQPQNWFVYCSVISILALSLCLVYLLYNSSLKSHFRFRKKIK